MLDLAINHKDELLELHKSIIFNDKYKYWNNGCYYDKLTIEESTWNQHQFVSMCDNKVIGYIGYSIMRSDGDKVYNINAINYSDNKGTFGKDLGQALIDIFEKFNFRTICFTVVVGNPIEKSYDSLVKKYGGRIVGIYKDYNKLIDGKLYDLKMYQISKAEYENSK